jgi:hypothetical protein
MQRTECSPLDNDDQGKRTQRLELELPRATANHFPFAGFPLSSLPSIRPLLTSSPAYSRSPSFSSHFSIAAPASFDVVRFERRLAQRLLSSEPWNRIVTVGYSFITHRADYSPQKLALNHPLPLYRPSSSSRSRVAFALSPLSLSALALVST